MDRLGVIGPLEFIPLAEKKTYHSHWERIIVQALRFAKRLQMCGYDTIKVFINVSLLNCWRKISPKIAGKNWPCSWSRQILVSKLRNRSLFLIMKKSTGFSELKDAAQISLDDFGTGYSHCTGRELNIHSLKVDKYFVDNMLVVGPDKAITRI